MKSRGTPEDIGKGHSEKKLLRSFQRHLVMLEEKIAEIAGDDPLKQLQLAEALNHRMKGAHKAVESHVGWCKDQCPATSSE